MSILTNTVVTTALTGVVSPVLQFREGVPESLTIHCNFTYGSGGTTWNVWVQSSYDGGLTWNDNANFSGTTANLRAMYNLCSNTPVTTQLAETDGTLAANTAKDGTLGTLFRTKVTTTGTYATSTTLRVDIVGRFRGTTL